MIILPVKVPDITTLFSPAGFGALLRKISAGTQNFFRSLRKISLGMQKNFTRHAEKYMRYGKSFNKNRNVTKANKEN